MTLRRATAFSVLFLFMALAGFGQSNEIKIRHVANAGLHMTDGNLTVYFDFPYKSGAYGYMAYDASELDKISEGATFLFTHRHADHYSKKLLKKLDGTVYGPWKIRKKDTAGVEIINDPDHHFSVRAYKNKHRFALKHCSYRITWHNKTIFVAGDAESPAIIATLQNIDWAFVPDWLLHYAKEGNVKIDAKHIGVYHLYPTQAIDEGYADNIHVMQGKNETISIGY